MNYFERGHNQISKPRFYKRKWFIFLMVVLLVFLVSGGYFLWKTGSTLNKISTGGVFKSLVKSLPGVRNELKGEVEGRINVALLGMRGENIEGGGLLADTIIVASIEPKQNRASMISIPRDLYVTVPGTQDKQKINAVHFYGEQKSKGQGLTDMQIVLKEVTGLEIHYAASINFAGFEKLVDALGGIEINLSESFSEPLQFREEHVCDPNVFTVPTGNYEYKKNERGRVVAQYPLCLNPKNEECGGEFSLPSGPQILNGEKALCYVRSRKTSSDFERAKRQQIMIQLIKDKLLSTGTILNFDKLNGLFNALGDNVRSTMAPWEMKRFFDIYSGMQNLQIYQRVLENNEEGLLYNPPANGAGYILLPIGDNYDRIHEMARNIFTLPAQSDIKPKN